MLTEEQEIEKNKLIENAKSEVHKPRGYNEDPSIAVIALMEIPVYKDPTKLEDANKPDYTTRVVQVLSQRTETDVLVLFSDHTFTTAYVKQLSFLERVVIENPYEGKEFLFTVKRQNPKEPTGAVFYNEKELIVVSGLYFGKELTTLVEISNKIAKTLRVPAKRPRRIWDMAKSIYDSSI
jgi:hypothetical protein